MSTNNFTFLLLGVCVVMIALVALINRFQEHRSRLQLLKQQQAKAAQQAQRQAQLSTDVQLIVPYEAPESEREVDELTEAVIDVCFGHPVMGGGLIELIQQYHTLNTKPVRFLGMRSDHCLCAPLQKSQEYASLQIAVTLANHHGPLNMAEWSQLYRLADQLAASFDGVIEHASPSELNAKAQQVYHLYQTYQNNITLFWVMDMPLPVVIVDQLLRAQGFEAAGSASPSEMRWLRRDHFGTVYQMCHVKACSPKGDVVRMVFEQLLALTLPTPQPFTDIMKQQRALMAPLHMHIVDEAGQRIQPEMDTLVDEELTAFYEQMRANGLWAGSYRFSRLFS